MAKQSATVSTSYGGNGFDGERRTKTASVVLSGYRKGGQTIAYEVGDIVRSGAAKGWLITAIK